MIPCQKCGHDNHLGAVFCHGCGVRLEVSLRAVAGSVRRTQADERKRKIFVAGRNALGLSAVLFAMAVFVHAVMAPDLPRPDLNPVPNLKVNELLPAETTWKPVAATQDLPIAPIAVELKAEPDLSAWRAEHGNRRLGECRAEMQPLRTRKEHILKLQKPDGSFEGADPVAATGLALLALQAMPPLPTDQEGPAVRQRQAVQSGRTWLKKQITSNAFLMNAQDLARILAIAALLDGGPEDSGDAASMVGKLADGKLPEIQAWALLSLPPAFRPKVLPALENALGDKPLYAHLLPLLGDGPITQKPDPNFFTWGTAQNLPAWQKAAWLAACWYRAQAPAALEAAIFAWSKNETAIEPPAELVAVAKDFADEAITIIICAGPARCPFSWVAQQGSK